MRLWVKFVGVFGLVGEFLAHGVLASRVAFPECARTDWFCTTGIPAAILEPILWYHVTVHAVLGFAVVLMVLPENVKKKLKVV